MKIIYIERGGGVLVKWRWTKELLTVNPMEKQITIMNTTSENITYLVDSKNYCVSIKIAPINI